MKERRERKEIVRRVEGCDNAEKLGPTISSTVGNVENSVERGVGGVGRFVCRGSGVRR